MYTKVADWLIVILKVCGMLGGFFLLRLVLSVFPGDYWGFFLTYFWLFVFAGLIPAFIARLKGDSFWGWWLLGTLTPVISIFIAASLADRSEWNGAKSEEAVATVEGHDFYVKMTSCTNEQWNYKIENDSQQVLWKGRACLAHKEIVAIELLVPAENQTWIMKAVYDNDSKRFCLHTQEGYSGQLLLRADGWILTDANGAGWIKIMEEILEDQSLFRRYGTEQLARRFAFCHKNGKLLGRYYVALQNLEIAAGFTDDYEIRSVLLAALLLDGHYNKYVI